jgi:hypothetical protein
MSSNHWLFKAISGNDASSYLRVLKSRELEKEDCHLYTRMEPRTRKKDFASALSFEVFDSLWMLARQWQFGRFKANDCGSAVTTKVKVSRRRLDSLYPRCNGNAQKAYSTDTPMEYEVEKTNRPISPFVRIESALHFKKRVEKTCFSLETKETAQQRGALFKQLIQLFPLEPFVPVVAEQDKTLETLKAEQNSNLRRLYAAYGKRTFDGYKLFEASTEKILHPLPPLASLRNVIEEYKAWFRKKYLPVEREEDNCWNERKMGYELGMGENANVYEAEDYHSGRLSWYSFDAVGNFSKAGKKEEKLLSYFPTPADFPCAPKRRLWEFEDATVQFGQQTNDDFSMLSNAVVMQYVTMYSNDWMLTPVEAEAGTVLDVEGILVTDTFGERLFIDTSAEQTDDLWPDVEFTDRWSLFGTARLDAYESNHYMPQGGLLFPPTLRRTEESKAIEEVQFLRDEMANMLWGIETLISDGCDGTWVGKDLSDAVLSVIDAQRGEGSEEEEHDYSFLVQNRVPLHWIPFIPQKTEGEIREIQFRRGRMPLFFNGSYHSVRPSTELLKFASLTSRKSAHSRCSCAFAPGKFFFGSESSLGFTPSSSYASSAYVSHVQPTSFMPVSSHHSSGYLLQADSIFGQFPGGHLLLGDILPCSCAGGYVLGGESEAATPNKRIPRFINEEEVTGYGVKLVLTAQRTRWFLGKSFLWTGAKKVLSQYQVNSGLMFDELIEKKSNKAIVLKKEENS